MKYRIDPIENFMENMGFIGRHEFEGNVAMMGEMTRNEGNLFEAFRYAPEELVVIFRDWINDLEDDIISYAEGRTWISAPDVALRFKISRESANYIIKGMIRKKRLNLTIA